jgi:alkylation response protein AidB-like acyl-CoA dehydrogenase
MPELASAAQVDTAGPVERVGRIAEIIRESGPKNEANGRLIPEVVDALHGQRLFRLLMPRAYGGDEVDLPTWFNTMEALGQLDGSTAWCIGQINGCASVASGVEPAVARKIWSEPRGALSWGPQIKSRANEVEGGYRVSGEWMMSSGSRHATWIGMMAELFDRDGKPVALPQGMTNRVFFTPAQSVEFIQNWDVVGLVATNSGGFKAENVFVPHGYCADVPAPLGTKITGPLYKFPLNALFSTGFSGVALGIARAMLDTTIAVAKEKNPWLARVPLRDNHMVQFQIGEAEARLRSARNNVEITAQRAWQDVVSTGQLTVPRRIDIRMATTFGIHEAKTVADTAWDIAGATAIFRSGPYERRMRDLRTLTQQLQGRKTHFQEAGMHLLGLAPNLRHM